MAEARSAVHARRDEHQLSGADRREPGALALGASAHARCWLVATESYAYAGDGTRLSASTGAGASQTTNYLWDRAFGLPQLALERDGADALLRSYRYGRGRISLTDTAGSYYYHHDGLGSVTDVTSPAGASLSWSESYPFGEVRLAGSGTGAPAIQPFGFAGEQLDSLTGLYHLRARQYDPAGGS